MFSGYIQQDWPNLEAFNRFSNEIPFADTKNAFKEKVKKVPAQKFEQPKNKQNEEKGLMAFASDVRMPDLLLILKNKYALKCVPIVKKGLCILDLKNQILKFTKINPKPLLLFCCVGVYDLLSVTEELCLVCQQPCEIVTLNQSEKCSTNDAAYFLYEKIKTAYMSLSDALPKKSKVIFLPSLYVDLAKQFDKAVSAHLVKFGHFLNLSRNTDNLHEDTMFIHEVLDILNDMLVKEEFYSKWFHKYYVKELNRQSVHFINNHELDNNLVDGIHFGNKIQGQFAARIRTECHKAQPKLEFSLPKISEEAALQLSNISAGFMTSSGATYPLTDEYTPSFLTSLFKNPVTVQLNKGVDYTLSVSRNFSNIKKVLKCIQMTIDTEDTPTTFLMFVQPMDEQSPDLRAFMSNSTSNSLKKYFSNIDAIWQKFFTFCPQQALQNPSSRNEVMKSEQSKGTNAEIMIQKHSQFVNSKDTLLRQSQYDNSVGMWQKQGSTSQTPQREQCNSTEVMWQNHMQEWATYFSTPTLHPEYETEKNIFYKNAFGFSSRRQRKVNKKNVDRDWQYSWEIKLFDQFKQHWKVKTGLELRREFFDETIRALRKKQHLSYSADQLFYNYNTYENAKKIKLEGSLSSSSNIGISNMMSSSTHIPVTDALPKTRNETVLTCFKLLSGVSKYLDSIGFVVGPLYKKMVDDTQKGEDISKYIDHDFVSLLTTICKNLKNALSSQTFGSVQDFIDVWNAIYWADCILSDISTIPVKMSQFCLDKLAKKNIGKSPEDVALYMLSFCELCGITLSKENLKCIVAEIQKKQSNLLLDLTSFASIAKKSVF